MKTYPEMITKTLHELLDHKETRKILEESIYSLFENPETRKIIEQTILQAVLKYGVMSKI